MKLTPLNTKGSLKIYEVSADTDTELPSIEGMVCEEFTLQE